MDGHADQTANELSFAMQRLCRETEFDQFSNHTKAKQEGCFAQPLTENKMAHMSVQTLDNTAHEQHADYDTGIIQRP